jgi:hypothetical protein
MGIYSEGQAPGTIENPDINWSELFYNPTLKSWGYRTDDGNFHYLSTGVTREQVEDLLANSFNDSSSIEWTYDDSANIFTAVVKQSILDSITNHTSNTGNPHSVTKSQVGLGNVDNTSDLLKPVSNATAVAIAQAKLRSQHSGTQLASTISDLKQFIDDYLDRNYDQNNNESVNTTTTMADRFNFDFTPKNTAVYKFELNLAHSHDNTGSNGEIEFLIDGVVQDDLEFEQQDAGGSEGSSGTDQKFKSELKYLAVLTSGTSYNLQCRYRTESNGVEATIKNHRFTYERYMP